MAFPSEIVGPICNAFLLRTEKLLVSPKPIISKIHYGVLTLKLLIENNEPAAVHHISLAVTEQCSNFLKAVFEFLSRDATQKASLDVMNMISHLISALFKHIAAQKDIIFRNEAVLDTILDFLLASSIDKLGKVTTTILRLMTNAIFLSSTRCPLQGEQMQSKAVTALQKILQCASKDSLIRIYAKATLAHLNGVSSSPSTCSEPVMWISPSEASCLFSLSGSESSTFSNIEVLILLKCLASFEQNKCVLLEENALDFLAPLVDDSVTQQLAAELICTLMSPDYSKEDTAKSNITATKDSLEICHKTPPLQDTDDSEGTVASSESFHNICTSNTITALFTCTKTCFESFTSACREKCQSAASVNLVYTTTLVRMIIDVLEQEDESVQAHAADDIATLPGALDTFVQMLWGSSVVLPLEFSQVMSQMWMFEAFSHIQKCLILLTNCSQKFCLSLCNAGLVYFVESELKRLEKAASDSGIVMIKQILLQQTLLILTIFYNCIKRKECLPLILCAKHISDSLLVTALSPILEMRFLSKLILGFLLVILPTEQKSMLVIQPDEALFLVNSLSSVTAVTASPKDEQDGFSLDELLQGLLNFSEMEDNLLICLDPAVLKVFDHLLSSDQQSCHTVILQIIWNVFVSTNEEIVKRRVHDVPTIKMLSSTTEIRTLQQCVLIAGQQQDSMDPVDIHQYARECLKYQKYSECIASADCIIHQAKTDIIDLSVVNEAKLLKGKSLFFNYQSMQQVYLRRRAIDPIKKVQRLKQQCYEKAKEAILLLGTANDHNFLDKEGSEILDYAMIDYLREMNDLKSCQRCLLCRKKTKPKRSHVFPKCILKDIAKDFSLGDNDHKVFCSMIGKVVNKKSAGEVTMGMLCGKCELLLCQNGEEQFFEQIYSNILAGREVMASQLKLSYGSWFYDFCIGMLFRSFAVADHSMEFFGTHKDMYTIFSNCRKHLLALLSTSSAQSKTFDASNGSNALMSSAPNDFIQIFFFVNPTISASSHKKLKCIPKTPASFTSAVSLDQGTYSHDRQPFVTLIHFDCMNVLIQLSPAPLPPISAGMISPFGGELVIPQEHERWQMIPTGVWKLFSAFAQAKEKVNIDDNNSKPNFVYFPENVINLQHSPIFSLLPSVYSCAASENGDKVLIQLPSGHRVLLKTSSQWGHQQEVVCLVAEGPHTLYLLLALSVPGWTIVDGLPIDVHNFRVVLPFLDGRLEKEHPLKLSVFQAFMGQHSLIKEYLLIREQLC